MQQPIRSSVIAVVGVAVLSACGTSFPSSNPASVSPKPSASMVHTSSPGRPTKGTQPLPSGPQTMSAPPSRQAGELTSGRGNSGPLQRSNAAPPQTGPQYTVHQYLEYMIKDLDAKWSSWFVQNGYNEPMVGYQLIDPGQSFTSTCRDQGKALAVKSDHPNAFFCATDSVIGSDGRRYQGLVILPVLTFQKMWQGDVFGRQSQPINDNDFAAAFIVAHEFGHHVQDELAKQEPSMRRLTGDNPELIADCFAGIWIDAMYVNRQLDNTDYQEATSAAALIGDAASGGGHGTAAERVQAVRVGAETGNDRYPAGNPLVCVNQYWR